MKNKFKIYFIDLDGTTLDSKKGPHLWVSKKNLKAIYKTRQNGSNVIISTGRIGATAMPFVDLINGQYFILGNGAQILDKNKKIIFDEKITIKNIIKIVDLAQKYQLIFRATGDLRAHGINGMINKFFAKKYNSIPTYGYNAFDLTKERHKFILWGKICRRKMSQIADELKEKIPGISVVTSYSGFTIEITSNKATKGLANAYVANLLKIPKSETAHVGDSMNDSTAKGKVGKLIVMKNADSKLKKMGDLLGPHYKDGGLSKILNGQTEKI